MKSPFPGMDPFMELRWRDLHNRLIAYIADQLQEQLPADLRAQIGERVLMEVGGEPTGSLRTVTYPDVGVLESRGRVAVAEHAHADLAEVQPDLIVEDDSLPERETCIEIVDVETGAKIITVIELLSPTNKLPGPGRDSYIAKQESYLKAGVNLVEVDLTRRGDRRTLMTHLATDMAPPYPTYLAVVHRFPKSSLQEAHRKGQREYYQLPIEKPLKRIRIPLRQGDKDVTLDLQSLIGLAYQKGRFSDLDYAKRLNPPLSVAEQAFLDQCLAARHQNGGAQE